MITCELKKDTNLVKTNGCGMAHFATGEKFNLIKRDDSLAVVEHKSGYYTLFSSSFENLFNWEIKK